jgi:glycosyltransferase involved in cell wall biosynthesis
LNEQQTLGPLLDEAKAVFAGQEQIDWEILVADNGSTDQSIAIAKSKGARVVSIAERGYGSAVNGGILAANTDYVVYADADGTYAPSDALKLVETLHHEQADLVLGNRMQGGIENGAMPFLHRYLGTPVLSFLLRWLHGVPTSDCNSGMRGIRRSAYATWQPLSAGMEFASSMLIQANHSGSKIIEFPVRLRRAPVGRIPHLRSWRDGMRHLLVVLSSAPHFFWNSGGVLLSFSTLIACLCFLDDIHLGVWGFGPHTLALATVSAYIGTFQLNVALMIYARKEVRVPRLAQRLIHLEEGFLLWSLAFLLGGLFVGVGILLWKWWQLSFGGLSYVKAALGIVYFEVTSLSLILGLFQVHLMKRLK